MKSKMTVALLSLLLMAGAVYGANVELKYSGPQGQGDLIWWAPSTGVTNMVLGTGGVSYVYFAGGGLLLDQISGTSFYRWLMNPAGSETSATYTRYDMLHVGSEVNAASTNAPIAGTYISVGRAAVAAGAGWAGGTFDTAVRGVAVNRATNNAAYGLRGGHIKAKNYTSGTVGGVEGLFIEAINDGTADSGEEVILKLGTDASTMDYGIDMDLSETFGTADIRFANGALIKNSSTALLTLTEAEVAIAGTLRLTEEVAAGAVVGSPDGFINLPTGVTTNANFVKISLNGTNYCVPMFKMP